MKKLIAMLLVAAMLLSMTACGSVKSLLGKSDDTRASESDELSKKPEKPDEPEEPEEAPIDEEPDEGPAEEPAEEEPAEEEPTETPDEGPENIMGVYTPETNTYENEFVGIGCQLDEEWEIFDEEQMAALNGLVQEVVTDEDIAKQLAEGGYLQPFYAQTEGGLCTMNLTLENLGVLYGSILDEKSYLTLAMSQVSPVMESLGMTDAQAEMTTVDFIDGSHDAVAITAKIPVGDSEVYFYETIVCLKVGSYIANLTVASTFTDITQEIFELFYAL